MVFVWRSEGARVLTIRKGRIMRNGDLTKNSGFKVF